jgi:mannose-6-phosphate isomerase
MTDLANLARRPHRLGPNKVPVYYAGGERIDRFRGVVGAPGPEDWVGSVTAFPPRLLPSGAAPTTGISPLYDEELLSEAVQLDPDGWLGPQLASAFSDEPGLLVKLLDAGERLPVHCHPTRKLARDRLSSRFGKTEGWIIMSADPGAAIWLGFRDEIDPSTLRAWIAGQDSEAMLAAMNRIEVTAGDVFYLPAGLPHSIGPGIMLTELQEPTSFSVLAEFTSFGLTEDQATLGLGWETAVSCFDLSAYDPTKLESLRSRRDVGALEREAMVPLFPPAADAFFQARRALVARETPLGDRAFAVLIVEHGKGSLIWDEGQTSIQAGETWVVPYGAGDLTATGSLELLICLPPNSELWAKEGR